MADGTLNKLLDLVADGESTDIRRAALKVVGAVGAKDGKLVKTLLETLNDPEQELRIAAIEALGQLQADDALKPLEDLVRKGGAELEPAVHAASLLGARGANRMGKVMNEVSPHLRSRIAAVLAKSNTGNALVVTAHGLLDADAKVIEATARSLAMEIPAYTSQQRHALAKFLIESLGAKKIAPRSEAAMLRIVSALHEGKAEDLFWSRILPPHSNEVRAAALQALGQAEPGTEKRLQALLTCAGETDFQIVAPALMMLKKVPATAKNSKHWIKLLDARDVATRRFAVEKLQGVESAEVAKALTGQMRHPDRTLRDAALKSLLSFRAGQAAILDELLATQDHDRAWFLARSLAPAAKDLPTAQRTKAFAQACKHHDAEDRRAAPLFFFLREIDHAWSRDQIEAKAQELRKKKKYTEAIGYYRLLAQDPACGEETRFELAATGLKQSSHELAADSRNNDPPLHQFTRLLQNAAFDLIGHVNKAKWLDAEDLFYLGFHFAEQTHRAQEFGKQVLEIVVKRSPKSDVGKQAKRKLKSQALM
ncbi:MAG: HEAT repeat domain-containing protein [Planctomycetes bacterium]|nr:HEAT repeat domain-containing protein [Planctomycetota bacterium]